MTADGQLRKIAAALDVEPDRLQDYVEYHPDPTVDSVLAMSNRPPTADETRERIAAWLKDLDGPAPPEERPGGIPAGGWGVPRLDENGGRP
jgi:hypothetical protein